MECAILLFFWVIGVEEFGLDLSAFVNVSTPKDEPVAYLCLFTDINHCTYSYDVGPSDFSIPHRTIEEFLNGKHLENKNELFKYYLEPRNYHDEELLYN